MFRGDHTHSGRSRHAAPATRPALRLAFAAGGVISGSPVIGEDGTIYFGSHDHFVYALAKDGRLRWKRQTGDRVFGTPALSADGATLYVGSDDDHLYALSASRGEPRWRFRVGACEPQVGDGPEGARCDVDSGPTVGPDGTLYVGGDGIYAISADGRLRWRFATTEHVASSPALSPDGRTVYAGCQDDALYALDAENGSKRWEYRTRSDVDSSPAVAADGTVYVGSDDGKLYALGPDGSLKFALTTPAPLRSSPGLAEDGTVYAAGLDGRLYAVRPVGTVAWMLQAGDKIISSPLVDGSGRIVVGSEDERLYAIDAGGRLLWALELDGDIDSSPALAADGSLVVGSDDGRLRVLAAKESKPAMPRAGKR